MVTATYFGDYPPKATPSREYLTMAFSSATVPLKERWHNNALSADFLADYFANFFPGNETAPTQTSFRAEIRGTISYIANELLENGLKFNYDPNHSISIRLELHADRLVFTLKNSINPDIVTGFQAFLVELIASEPMEMYVTVVEQNALDAKGSSGLGFLTMLNDYGARLGWCFETFEAASGQSPLVMLTTLVQVGL